MIMGCLVTLYKNRPPLIELTGIRLIPAPPGSGGGVSPDQIINLPCPYYVGPNDATTSRRCTRVFCRCANKNDCARFKVAGHFKPTLSKVQILKIVIFFSYFQNIFVQLRTYKPRMPLHF